MPIIRYTALYCRISKNSPTNDESNSIVNQKILLQRAAVQYNFEHTQLFVDDGYSGTVFDRPALKQMEDAIRAGMVCAVLVKDDCVIIELNAESPIKCGFCAVSSIF